VRLAGRHVLGGLQFGVAGRRGHAGAVSPVLLPGRGTQPLRAGDPGSFHEGGELGYSLLHAYGAALDHPSLLVLCVVGDGEAETGALATSWHCNKFLNPARDGAVLPVLHLNQYKIANPTLLARISHDELLSLLQGYGYAPHMVSGDDPAAVHQSLAAVLETLAATSILRQELPDLHVRVINVVDLMRLVPESDHPHGLPDAEFDTLFTVDRPVIFAFHGYPWLVHRLTYNRHNHDQMHVRGYQEKGTTTTPFDMVMLNNLDRYHLVMDVIDRVPGLGPRAADLRQQMADARQRARTWTREYGEDIPEVAQWTWPG